MTAAWSPWLMTRSAAAAYAADPGPEVEALLLGQAAGLLSEAQRVGRLTPLPVASGPEGQGVGQIERLADVLGQVDGPDQLLETAVEVAEEERPQPGEERGQRRPGWVPTRCPSTRCRSGS